jgi:hypothetical protein
MKMIKCPLLTPHTNNEFICFAYIVNAHSFSCFVRFISSHVSLYAVCAFRLFARYLLHTPFWNAVEDRHKHDSGMHSLSTAASVSVTVFLIS